MSFYRLETTNSKIQMDVHAVQRYIGELTKERFILKMYKINRFNNILPQSNKINYENWIQESI